MPQLITESSDENGRVVRVYQDTAAEIAFHNAMNAYQEAYALCLKNREEAYVAEGWMDAFQIDDWKLKNGEEAYWIRRQEIKDQFPKPVMPTL
jgi:hypothetical protein